MSDNTGASAGTLYVPGFKANLNLSPQQTKSRLLSFVDVDLNYSEKGQFFNADDVGTADPTDVVARVPDSPDGFVDIVRRFGAFKPFADGRFVDDEDKARMLEDPTNEVMMAMMAGMGRKRDLAIIAGLGGAYQYQDNNQNYQTGTTNQNLIPANDSFASAAETVAVVQNPTTMGYGLTVGKLIETRTALDNAELDELQPGEGTSNYVFACTANQIRDLFVSVPVTNAFYNEVHALQEGKINDFLGFRFVRLNTSAGYNPLPKASYTRTCYAFHRRAILYRGRPIQNAHVSLRPDKSFRYYAYYEADHGAVRRYDGGVWAVNCDERTQLYT